MNYKETLFFIGKCLTVVKDKTNRQIVEEVLQKNNINWDNIVKVSTSHYVFTTLYCNFKKVNFLHYLPKDLVDYMQHITSLNKERNQQIINQAKEINQLLTTNNIYPIFLKGTGNLLEGLYDDIAERMVGDIDFLVEEKNFLNTVRILKNNGYTSDNKESNKRTFHWHYDKLIKKNAIASVEVHNRILSKADTKYFNVFSGETKHYTFKEYSYLTNKYKLLNTTLPKIVNDNLYVSKTFSLRNMYDTFLISHLENTSIPNIKSKSLQKKLINYIACMELVFGTSFFKETKNNYSKAYIKQYIKKLNGSRLENFKTIILVKLDLLKNKLKITINAFTDKDYRSYVLRKFFN